MSAISRTNTVVRGEGGKFAINQSKANMMNGVGDKNLSFKVGQTNLSSGNNKNEKDSESKQKPSFLRNDNKGPESTPKYNVSFKSKKEDNKDSKGAESKTNIVNSDQSIKEDSKGNKDTESKKTNAGITGSMKEQKKPSSVNFAGTNHNIKKTPNKSAEEDSNDKKDTESESTNSILVGSKKEQKKPHSVNIRPHFPDLDLVPPTESKGEYTIFGNEFKIDNLKMLSNLKSQYSKMKSQKIDQDKFDEINKCFDSVEDSKTVITFSLTDSRYKEVPVKNPNFTSNSNKEDEDKLEKYMLRQKIITAKNQISRMKSKISQRKNKSDSEKIGPEIKDSHNSENENSLNLKTEQKSVSSENKTDLLTEIKNDLQNHQKVIENIYKTKFQIQNYIDMIQNYDIIDSLYNKYYQVSDKFIMIKSSKK